MLIDPQHYKDKFEKTVNKFPEFAIVPHYNPDPDALGSAFGMYYLLTKIFSKKCSIYFSGIIGRAENKMMINLLDIPIVQIRDNEQIPTVPVILTDTQPGTGNNPLSSQKKPVIVIDHHPILDRSRSIRYADIRLDYGSSSSIIYNYYKQYDLKPSVNVATALYYGIQTDVVGEGRRAKKIDFTYMEDLSRYINREKLYSIEKPKLPFDYYIHINKGMENSVIYNDFLFTTLGEIENPDYIGEIADFLIRFKGAFMVLVLGKFQNTIQLSFRSQRKKIDAGLIMKKIVGKLGSAGGHSTNAGGRVLLEEEGDAPRITKRLLTRALNLIHGKITSGVPFLSMGDYLNM
jgi:nanoRNase/pAp phosphatase (c-di-AMP/oligoRNAs hydrolase)